MKKLTKSLYTPEWLALCDRLRELRESKGVTQIELAQRLKQPQSFVCKVEAAQRKLDLRQFVIYVRALDGDPLRIMRQFVNSFDKVDE